MPVPKPVFDPPFNIVRCSHVILDVTDLDVSRAFYETAVGLHVEDCDDKAVYLRGSEEHQHHSLVLRKSAAPACSASCTRPHRRQCPRWRKARRRRRRLPAAPRRWLVRWTRLRRGFFGRRRRRGHRRGRRRRGYRRRPNRDARPCAYRDSFPVPACCRPIFSFSRGPADGEKPHQQAPKPRPPPAAGPAAGPVTALTAAPPG